MTGYMFGKGVYLADVVSKAASYCHAKADSPEGLLILAEAALGSIFPCHKAKNFKNPPTYFHSVFLRNQCKWLKNICLFRYKESEKWIQHRKESRESESLSVTQVLRNINNYKVKLNCLFFIGKVVESESMSEGQ